MSAIRAATFSLCVFGSLFTLGMMVYAGRGWREGAEWWMSFIALGLWNLVPFDTENRQTSVSERFVTVVLRGRIECKSGWMRTRVPRR